MSGNKIVLFIMIFLLCLAGGFCSAKYYQTNSKSLEIYKHGLENYNNKDYQNSYYLFSKISNNSNLKPAAIYRQSLCAKSLGDEKSELYAYRLLIKKYPSNPLTTEALYKAGQILQDTNPEEAKEYFEKIINSHANEDYKIASKYFISKIDAKQGKNNCTSAQILEIEENFRNYLTKHPDGRLAAEVAKTWETFNSSVSSKDSALIAKVYLYADLNSQAEETLSYTSVPESWAIRAILAKKQGKIAQMKDLVLQGVSKYASYVPHSDYNRAVMEYLKTQNLLYSETSSLLNLAKGENRDYIWNLKCQYSASAEKNKCYNELYANYPTSEYSETIVPNLVLYRMINGDYKGAKDAADNFLLRYPNSSQAPFIMFWKAKAEQKLYPGRDYKPGFNEIISKFPDSYYAYRAFWIVQGYNVSVLDARYENREIEYPYNTVSPVMKNLIQLEDYEIIERYSDDEFVKSWAQYKKGNYTTSMHNAKLAMVDLETKPPKNDLRWRLVYPINYFDEIEKFSKQYNNNSALILALVKEESSFNPNAQSGVGAIGLMQLMPATAHDVASRYGLNFATSDLVNPQLNLKIGNMYYSNLRKQLDNRDISAIASYNGGIGSVQKWQSKLFYHDSDEFVEQIPYEETRNYVKKVLGSYWNYIRIYQQ